MAKNESKKAAIYIRVSTEEQIQGTSLDHQRRVCIAEAEKKGYEVLEHNIFIDAGISGTDDTRPAWNRMLAAAERKEIHIVIVQKLDRFSRKAATTIVTTDRLDVLGVALIVVDEGIDMSTSDGRFVRSIMAGMAEMDRDRIIERTTTGQRNKSLIGGWSGGQPPYGWKLNGRSKTAKPVASKKERKVIELVTKLLVVERFTVGQVATYLNQEGIKPRKADVWERETVRQMMKRSSLYDGIYTWGSTAKHSNDLAKHKTRVNPDGTPKYGKPAVLTMPDPPLTKPQWDLVQKRMRLREVSFKPRPRVTQLLTGKLYGECGNHYNGVSLADSVAYRCSGRRIKFAGDKNRCLCPQLRAEGVEDVVWDEVSKVLSNPEALAKSVGLWLGKPSSSSVQENTKKLVQINTAIDKEQRALRKLKELALYDDDEEFVEKNARELKSKLDLLIRQKGEIELVSNNHQSVTSALTDSARLIERALSRIPVMPLEYKRELLEILNVRVDIKELKVHKARQWQPSILHISGVIDPRLLVRRMTASENTNPEGPSSRFLSAQPLP